MPHQEKQLRRIVPREVDAERAQLEALEQRFPEGFIFRTERGEFQFTPGGVESEGRIRPVFQRVPTRQFIPKIPIIISSERAREKFQKNLERLQQFERQFQNVGSTQPIFRPEPPKPEPNLRGVI